jgi:hypothetical protein
MRTPAKTRRPLVITRGQVAQAASLIGVGALIAAVIGVIWQSGVNPLIGGLLALSALGIGIWAAVTPADFVGFITGRRIRYGTFAAFSTMLLIGVVVMVFLFLSRATLTLDMTSNRLYTLSQASLNLIQRVSRPIQITGFYTPASLPVREIDDQFFRLYSVASDNLIRRVYIDPIEQPAVAQRFGVTDDAQVFISYLNEDGTVDFSSVARVPRGSSQERDLSNALARLLIRGSIKVYVNQSLGERGLTDLSQNGISGIYNGMQESGLVPLPISITALAQQNGEIPRDAAALLFIRPTADLTEAQIGIIDRYLSRGGDAAAAERSDVQRRSVPARGRRVQRLPLGEFWHSRAGCDHRRCRRQRTKPAGHHRRKRQHGDGHQHAPESGGKSAPLSGGAGG